MYRPLLFYGEHSIARLEQHIKVRIDDVLCPVSLEMSRKEPTDKSVSTRHT